MRIEDKEYASKGVAGTALGISIGAGVLSLFQNGALGNLFGGNHNHEGYDSMTAILPVLMSMVGNRGGFYSEPYVTRHELDMQNEIAKRDMELAYWRGRDASKSDALELYRYFDGRDREREAQINAVATSVAVSNTQTGSAIACLQQTVDMLKGLTKVNIPVTSVCPTPMLQYNSWTAPTTTTTTAAG